MALETSDEKRLIDIAKTHFGDSAERAGLYERVAKQLIAQGQSKHQTKETPPSAAEYLDTIRACLELGIEPNDET